jgi:hypothetical protein
MEHTHNWKRDPNRKHKRPPRFFVICNCGARSQAVMRYGFLHPFNTHKESIPEFVKKPYSIRLNSLDVAALKNGRAVLVVSDHRLRLQYKP